MILIDHTRSFARDTSLPEPEEVVRCSRGLWHNLRHLDETVVQNRLSPYLSKREIDAIFVRRDRIVRMIQELIDEKGEENVLFYKFFPTTSKYKKGFIRLQAILQAVDFLCRILNS